jgi:hypothetical protein
MIAINHEEYYRANPPFTAYWHSLLSDMPPEVKRCFFEPVRHVYEVLMQGIGLFGAPARMAKHTPMLRVIWEQAKRFLYVFDA